MKCGHFNIIFAIICLISISIVTSITSVQNKCTSKQKCGECIQTKNCAWCTKEDFLDQPRCIQQSSELFNSCVNFTINPQNSGKVIKSEILTRTKLKNDEIIQNDENPKIVQITPQKVSVKLRPNEIYKLNFQYSQAEDNPIDLYYLMDLSRSMLDHKKKLSKLGNELASEMKKISRNFKLGFGSFVDKVLMPYTSTMPEKLINPCDKGYCDPPYSYIHHMTLDNNTSQFAEKVNLAQVSGNIDTPEGGFDAIMQAVVCRKEIGWRDEARRLLVFSTDAGFHYAGDGKLAGLIEPNDGQCHMENNRYTHAEILDYPSVSHLNHVIKENSVNIIFVVTKGVGYIYGNLSNSIEGSSYGVLDGDSSNVVRLIKGEYDKITSGVEIKDNAMTPINITYFSSCLISNGTQSKTNKCTELKDDTVIDFTAEILVSECPKNKKDWRQTIKLYPVGINENLMIDLEILCECDCEKPGGKLYELNSKKCNNQGTYKCGLCDCNDKYYGRRCECSSDFVSTETSSKGCRPNNTTLLDCSGLGVCLCGVCQCDGRPNAQEVISGPYCECDNFSCEQRNNLLCSGEDHGICECSQCSCKPEWKGAACECKISNDTCLQSPAKKICSGHGTCECGDCICDSRYYGRYCEHCPTCEKRCEEFKSCVECKIHKTGPLKDEDCTKNCSGIEIIIVDKIESTKNNNDEENNDWEKCKAIDENNCEFLFEYKESPSNENEIIIRAEKEQKCPPIASAVKTSAFVILPILGFGLFFLLSWKVITTIHDRREYSKFEKEKLMAKWDTGENPIYKEATSMYRNPGFDK